MNATSLQAQRNDRASLRQPHPASIPILRSTILILSLSKDELQQFANRNSSIDIAQDEDRCGSLATWRCKDESSERYGIIIPFK
jgi:hypothetical protein